MVPVVTVTVGGIERSLCFSAYARVYFERCAGYSLTQLKFWRSEVSELEIVSLVTAGLEGARRREKSRAKRWTEDEVLDEVLDPLSPEDHAELTRATLEAIRLAFPAPPADDGDSDDDAEVESGKA